jgi:hypothetical protein
MQGHQVTKSLSPFRLKRAAGLEELEKMYPGPMMGWRRCRLNVRTYLSFGYRDTQNRKFPSMVEEVVHEGYALRQASDVSGADAGQLALYFPLFCEGAKNQNIETFKLCHSEQR